MAGSKTKKELRVYLKQRELDALEDGKVIRTCSCLIGRPGHETKPGKFRVLEKKIDKVSGKYNAPMPYSLKFDTGWKAIHQSSNFFVRNLGMSLGVDGAGSHGCVGLAESDAKAIYEWAQVGTPVNIFESR